MSSSPRTALARLEAGRESGELGRLCQRHGITLMVVFGSALHADGEPSDLDLAVRFNATNRDILQLHEDLYRLTGSEEIDLMVLGDAGPLARERAMTTGTAIYEKVSGAFANEQMAAIMERLETDHFRQLQLELLTR